MHTARARVLLWFCAVACIFAEFLPQYPRTVYNLPITDGPETCHTDTDDCSQPVKAHDVRVRRLGNFHALALTLPDRHVVRTWRLDLNNGLINANFWLGFGQHEIPGFADGLPTAARFANPHGIDWLSDDPYNFSALVCDTGNYLIRVISIYPVEPAEPTRTIAGSRTEGLQDGIGTKAAFFYPRDIAMDYTSKFAYIADMERVRVLNVTSTEVFTLYDIGSGVRTVAFFGNILYAGISNGTDSFSIVARNSDMSSLLGQFEGLLSEMDVGYSNADRVTIVLSRAGPKPLKNNILAIDAMDASAQVLIGNGTLSNNLTSLKGLFIYEYSLFFVQESNVSFITDPATSTPTGTPTTRNPVPSPGCQLVPYMTSQTAPCGMVSNSIPFENQTSMFDGWKAFDNQTRTSYISFVGVPFAWIQYEFGGNQAFKVTQYRYLLSTSLSATRKMMNWMFQGSNDTSFSAFDVLDEHENDPSTLAGWHTYPIENTKSYKAYRLFVTATNGVNRKANVEAWQANKLVLENYDSPCPLLCASIAPTTTRNPSRSPAIPTGVPSRSPVIPTAPSVNPSMSPISEAPTSMSPFVEITASPSEPPATPSRSPATHDDDDDDDDDIDVVDVKFTTSPSESPSMESPSESPVTLSPSKAPTTSTPSTGSPTTTSPSLAFVSGYFVNPSKVIVREDFPPWARAGVSPFGSASFYIQNLYPDGSPITATCRTSASSVLRVEASNDPSLENGHILAGSDPTEYTCLVENGVTVVRCNGRQIAETDANYPSTRCDPQSLVAQGVIVPQTLSEPYACPHPCFGLDANGCDGGAVGLFSVSSVFNPTLARSGSTSASVVCSLQQGGGEGEFSVGVQVEDVAWPAVSDWLIKVRGRFISSVLSTQARGSDDLSAYAVSLSQSTEIVAVANEDYGGVLGFGGRCPSVFVGGVQANVLTCSGSNVTFEAPRFDALCKLNEECDYQQVVISNADDLIPNFKGANLSCPGACSVSGLGFFYTEQCVGFNPPEECAQPSPDCAFGLGDSCRQCSPNAICPGGFRMWPVPGYWTANEQAGSVIQCPAPPRERCRGWRIVSAESDCGEGYTGDLCASCADGFYEQLNTCTKCPEESNLIARLTLLFIFALVLFLTVFLCLHWSPIRHMGKHYRGLLRWQAEDFVIWTMLSLQLFSVVVSSADANAHEATEVLSWINIASFDVQAVGPECFSSASEAFVREYVILSASVAAIALTAGTTGFCSLGRTNTAKKIRGYLMSILIALYTPATFLSVGITYCIKSNNEEGGLLVSWANPNFECGGEAHAAPMALGVITLLFHSIGFPIWSLLKIRAVYSAQEEVREMKLAAAHYRKFFGDDYFPEYCWVLQTQMALASALSCTRVYLSSYNEAEQASKFVINIALLSSFGAMLAWLKPYVKHMEWKLPAQLSILCLLVLTTFLDLFNYLASEEKMPRDSVEAFSIFVLAIALLNFALLGAAFWYVVFSKKNTDYYKDHFMIRYQGTIVSKSDVSKQSGGVRRVQRRSGTHTKSKLMASQSSMNIDTTGNTARQSALASPMTNHSPKSSRTKLIGDWKRTSKPSSDSARLTKGSPRVRPSKRADLDVMRNSKPFSDNEVALVVGIGMKADDALAEQCSVPDLVQTSDRSMMS